MAGPPETSPTSRVPQFDLTLSDGTDTLGFIFCDAGGRPSKRFERMGMPSDALLASQGQSEYSNYEPGYMRVEQTDWSGGRGLNDFDKDRTRYYDGRGILPISDGIIPGPLIHYSDGFTIENKYLPDDATSATLANLNMNVGNAYYATPPFTPSSNYDAKYVEFWVKKGSGSPNDLTVYLYLSDGTNPTGSALATATMDDALYPSDATYEFVRLTFPTAYTVSTSSQYHIVFKAPSNSGSSTYWTILAKSQSGTGARYSTNGTSWSALNYYPFYRIRPSSYTGNVIFVDYKRALYAVTQPDSGQNSYLWINGDRGAADSNSGQLSKLIDATKSWTTNEWVGCKVLIIAGPGSEEVTPWRTITANDSNSLTVSPNWNITHTTSTEYVILGSDKWSVVSHDFTSVSGSTAGDLGGFVTDVTVTGDYIYFARGDTADLNVIRYQEYNSSGTWTRRDALENVEARNICAIRHPEDDTATIYGSIHDHPLYGACLWKAKVPKAWGNLYRDYGVVIPTEELPASDVVAANTQLNLNGENLEMQVLNDTFATGVIAKATLNNAVNIMEGEYLSCMIKSTISVNAGDFEFEISDNNYASGHQIDLDVPALNANEWTWVTIDIGDIGSATYYTIYSELKYWRFKVEVDKNAAYTINIQDGIHLTSDIPQYIDLPNHVRINKIVPYGGSQTEPRKNPWVITEDSIYEIQTQNNDAVVPIPLDEISALRGGDNGQSAGVNDVYFYFNLGRKFERYFNRNLDDIGPDLDDGLPEDRQGILSGFVSYPGRVIVTVDSQSTGTSGGYSSIMMLSGTSWNELYRSHTLIESSTAAGTRFRGIGFQNIPGSSTGKLWFRMHEALCWIPISLNPFSDADYTYTHEAILESPWIYAGTKGIKKAWKSITIFADCPSGCKMFVDYKLDDESDSWTIGTTEVIPAPSIELDIAGPPPVGYRIKYRIRISQVYPSGNVVKIRAIIINCFGIAPIKHGYSFMARVVDDYGNLDLENTPQPALGYNERVETAIAKLDSWAQNLTPLTMHSVYSLIDNKTVLLKDPRILGISYNADNQVEEHLLQITVHDM